MTLRWMPAARKTAIAIATSSLLACHSSDNATGDVIPDAAARALTSSAAAPVTAIPDIPQRAPPSDVGAVPPNATWSAAALASRVLTPGGGTVHPYDLDLVRFNYVGWTRGGRTFAASGNEPVTIRLREANPPGLAEALRLMVAGEKRRVWIGPAIGFDERAQRNGSPGGDLVMDVELVEIVPTPSPPPTPPDAMGPQRGAHTTPSGLSYRLLASGAKRAPRPTSGSIVVYNYTTWTMTGALLDSTIPEGQPRSAFLAQLEPHWRSALGMMKVGDRMRFWFTPDPASDPSVASDSNAKTQSLVVDVELIYVYAVDSRGS